MVSSRMVTSSRRAGRVTNKTRLLVVRGTKEADLQDAEVIVWDDGSGGNGEATKHQHVGAKGVESGELLEHHLQAALSSASLLHSRPAKAESPTPSTRTPKSEPAVATTNGPGAALNYHIPTPDATGVIQEAAYATLYKANVYHEPHGFIRFSDTVEEASGGMGGLGYCMDDRDEEWLTAFNAKAEGGSGESTLSPLKDSKVDNAMPPPPSLGRPKREKGKEKEKEEKVLTPINISEDVFEFIMGMLEKNAEDNVPMLHTDLSLLPDFASVEHLFASPISPSFLPSFEVPRSLPAHKDLVRMAQRVYSHWKERRVERKGKTIMPSLNYDETNDGDPYVCFRRRDIRATRKTRRTDNISIERMQRLQVEMRQAHLLSQMVLRRETEKLALYKAEKEVWEAKWKLFETKRRWPSLGVTRDEEELITGKQTRESQMAAAGVVNASMLAGRDPLSAQRDNIPSIRRKHPDGTKEDKERRDSRAMEATRNVEKGLGMGSGSKAHSLEVLKERQMVLKKKLEEELLRRKVADAEWDDATDHSYQPLPASHAAHAFRPVTTLDPYLAQAHLRLAYEDEDESPLRPLSFRLRRGRGGAVRLDRRLPTWATHRGAMPKSASAVPDWLFPDSAATKPSRPRPKSIVDVEDDAADERHEAKRRRLNEMCRYDVNKGGALGVGMGVSADEDRVIIDDLDLKYMRQRITLLQDDDVDKLRPDLGGLISARQSLDAPEEMPPTPIFNRPTIVPPNPQIVAQMQQQQMMQQQQIEQFQRYQMMAQQQAMAQQQHNAAMAAQQRGGDANGAAPNGASAPVAGAPVVNGMPPPAGRPPMKRPPSAQNGNVANGNMPPPQGRPNISPTNAMHVQQSPQMINGVPIPVQGQQKPFIPQQGANLANLDPAIQQRIRQMHAQQVQANGAAGQEEPTEELARLAQQAGYGTNIQGFIDARNRAMIITAAKQQQQQLQQQAAQQQQQQQAQNGTPPVAIQMPNAGAAPGFQSPQIPNGAMQLKLPAHAAARLGAVAAAQNQQPQRA